MLLLALNCTSGLLEVTVSLLVLNCTSVCFNDAPQQYRYVQTEYTNKHEKQQPRLIMENATITAVANVG